MSDMGYAAARRLVDPVENLLEAVIAVNWWMAVAQKAGWSVVLIVGESGVVEPLVSRSAPWPEPDDDLSAQGGGR